jgi:hypothetical protein
MKRTLLLLHLLLVRLATILVGLLFPQLFLLLYGLV